MDYFSVGEIVNTFGIKGEIKLSPETIDENRFENPNPYYIGDDKVKVHIEKHRKQKSVLIIKFKEFNNINDVEKFKKQKLYVEKSDLVDLGENEYFIHDLIGLKVINDGKEIGKLSNVLQGYSNDVYAIRTKEKEILIPAVKDFIKEVDIENNKIYVNLIEGMMWFLILLLSFLNLFIG